ncbi:heavy metal translocating P-type ATPase [Naasia lichenicola]|uniref:Heavy metal translocating P-type ATPase n=2 Tax=Naasia lichenicola TaxID=2565933 RepID=A0A4S4FP97_9MICO|nr:heavy metal translocating P-type ATPase [Naasia lichenicola]
MADAPVLPRASRTIRRGGGSRALSANPVADSAPTSHGDARSSLERGESAVHDHRGDAERSESSGPTGHHPGHTGHAAHGDHGGHDPALFRRKLLISLALAIPTLIFSRGLQDILGLTGPRFPGSDLIPAVFGTAIFVYGGVVFLRGGYEELRARTPGMMTLISLAIVVAFGYSLAVLFGLNGMDFWWELATLIVIMLLGHWIEMSAVLRAGNALGELAALLPDTAERLRNGSSDEGDIVPVSELQLGDRVIVRPGSRIPADGRVLEGESTVDESLLTGESAPVAKVFGSALIAGSVSTRWLTLEVTRIGGDTALAGIMRLVADAQASRSDVQLLADRAAKWLFYVALGVAFLTFVVWAIIRPDDPAFVLERVVTVLVIACPHALGLAIPLAALISTTTGARSGLLVRSRAALEEARLVDVVLFDKTGTLTQGKQGVVDIIPAVTSSTGTISVVSTRTGSMPVVDPGELASRKAELLSLAANAEGRSEHPIGRAIVAEGRLRGISPLLTTEFVALPGRGVQADVRGRKISVLGPRALIERGLHGGADIVLAAKAAHARGESVVFVLERNEVLGLLSVADTVRPESKAAIDALHRRGVRVAMVTGDTHEVGSAVASQLGIDEVYAEVLPGEKAKTVAELQSRGARVAMVGDGVNDAPALAQADVGIAIGAGTGVAIESAGIVLASNDPRGVADVLTLSRATYRTMLQNLGWAAGYNVIALPLAAGVAIGAGVVVSPAVGALLMSVSTIVVALNAQLLRRVRLTARR